MTRGGTDGDERRWTPPPSCPPSPASPCMTAGRPTSPTSTPTTPRGGPRAQVPAWVPARILALTRASPPAETGLSHWSSRQLAAYLKGTEGVWVSWHYVAKLWRDNDLRPHRQGTFKLSKDPRFAEKVVDIVGLYLQPPGGA